MGGYTPTPIALLKSVQKAKNEAGQKNNSRFEENDNEKDVMKEKIKKGKMKDKAKVKKVANVEASKPQLALKKQESTKEKLQSVTKKKLDKQLSIEDLFDADVCL